MSISWGEGSRGNRGVNNQGAEFEQVLFEQFKAGEGELVRDIYEQYALKDPSVDLVGDKCTPRPLTWEPTMKIGRGWENIGDDVADLRLYDKKFDQTINLSLKSGSHVSFCNVGVQKCFPWQCVEQGDLPWTGKRLLSQLGVREDLFCQVFKNYANRVEGEEIIEEHGYLEGVYRLLSHAVGFGYHMVHKKNADTIYHGYMTENCIRDMLVPDRVRVIYPANSKRVRIEVDCGAARFKLALRNKDGRISPTFLVFDGDIDHSWMSTVTSHTTN